MVANTVVLMLFCLTGHAEECGNVLACEVLATNSKFPMALVTVNSLPGCHAKGFQTNSDL